MPGITLDLADAAELAEMLTFLADWLAGSQKQALADSLTTFVGHPAYNTQALCADLHRARHHRTELTTCPASRSTWPTQQSSQRCSPSSPTG